MCRLVGKGLISLTPLTGARRDVLPQGSGQFGHSGCRRLGGGEPRRGVDGLFLTPVIAWFLVTYVGEYSPRVKPEHSPEKSVGFDVYPITVHGIEEEITALKEPGGAFSILNIRGGMSEADLLSELKSKPD